MWPRGFQEVLAPRFHDTLSLSLSLYIYIYIYVYICIYIYIYRRPDRFQGKEEKKRDPPLPLLFDIHFTFTMKTTALLWNFPKRNRQLY